MKKFILGVIIGSLLICGISFAREIIAEFDEAGLTALNDEIKSLWFEIDDLVPRHFDVTTIADGDTTPDVSAGNFFITSSNSGATAISDLDNPRPGQTVYIIGGSNNNSSTIADAGNFNISGAFTASLDDVIVLFVQADNDYIQIGGSNN